MAYVQSLPRSLVALLWLLAAAAGIASGHLRAHDLKDSLVKIRALSADGSPSFGSGVVIATNRLASACHVAREAVTIEVTHGDKRWVAFLESGSLAHDLCLLSVPDLDLPAVTIRASAALQLGERVIAVGFPGGGEVAVTDGAVEGLYPYEGGNVIRTSANFDAGASGGGLFDAEGALVGLLAFKARTGAKLHFALPADWALPGAKIASLLGPIPASSKQIAFWQQPRTAQPAFLGHALLEAASPR